MIFVDIADLRAVHIPNAASVHAAKGMPLLGNICLIKTSKYWGVSGAPKRGDCHP